jgi:hypothetical protein
MRPISHSNERPLLPIIDSFLFHQHTDGFLNITMAGLGLEQLNVREC